jgi:hypothetical protein
MDGDSGVTTCRAAFGVAMAQTTPGSGFEFGIDLKMQDPVADGGGPSGVIAYTKANIRMENDVVVMVDDGVPTDGTTGDNFAGPGSHVHRHYELLNLYIQTSLISDSDVWKLVTRAA